MSTLTFDESTAAITRIAVIAALDDDGDRYELDDGRTLVLRIEPDDIDAFDNINGCDAYGRVAWPSRWPRGEAHGRWGNEARPNDMTGRAVKLRTMGGDAFWWEPYHEDGAYAAPTSAERSWMADLVTFGFRCVSVRLLETVTDSRGNDHEVEAARADLSGIDTLDECPFEPERYVRNGYLREILGDLLAELGIG